MTLEQENIYEVLHTIGWELIDEIDGIANISLINESETVAKAKLYRDGTVMIDKKYDLRWQG